MAENLGVLAFKISVLRQEFVIFVPVVRQQFYAIYRLSGINILRQKLFMLSCAGANLGVLAFKISVLRQKLVIICATRAGAKFSILAFKIGVLR